MEQDHCKHTFLLILISQCDPVLQPFTHGFPHADIHTLLSSDLLHQLIKGTFKDCLVEWVNEYLHITHSKACALEIIHDIDQWCIDSVWMGWQL